MTKKELLENKVFQNMPEDTEIVFNTCCELENCLPVQLEDLSYHSKIVGFAKRYICGGQDPIRKHYMVIHSNHNILCQ